jgi:hypothetical protein
VDGATQAGQLIEGCGTRCPGQSPLRFPDALRRRARWQRGRDVDVMAQAALPASVLPIEQTVPRGRGSRDGGVTLTIAELATDQRHCFGHPVRPATVPVDCGAAGRAVAATTRPDRTIRLLSPFVVPVHGPGRSGPDRDKPRWPPASRTGSSYRASTPCAPVSVPAPCGGVGGDRARSGVDDRRVADTTADAEATVTSRGGDP